MKNIPTAEEFVLADLNRDGAMYTSTKEHTEKNFYAQYNAEELPEMLIQFAKLHVEAVLKVTSEIANQWENSGELAPEILSSYPLTNIK